ncbi:MAG: ABC transporter substrate-binding protein [Chelatococcus sp.]|uniref:ABC transporter substrate-binding protein n=1 Tax=Chelatococcus sp. TaxID=1953771 RepID=UPI0025B809EB|nr:ABC transporter substrate-binding protein [Chelatococcus sp.]MBX3540793.1 ABC transporter substrate-binding protein [Chelatococcus sp.]
MTTDLILSRAPSRLKTRLLQGIFGAVLLAGFAASPAASTAAAAKTLRIGAQADAGTMDPQAQNIQTTISLLNMIYEPLVTRDKSLAKTPALAESWSQTAPDTWRFKLRPNVKFHDGSPLTAEDVAFTIKRAQGATSQFTSYSAGLTPKIVDDLTIDIATPKPDPLLPDKIMNLPIMSKLWTEKNGALEPQNLKEKKESFTALNANGTGPYKLVSRAPDSKTVLARSPTYWGKLDGDIDEVVFMPIGSDPTRMAALVSGEIDIAIDVPSQDVARLSQNPDLKISKVDEFRTIFFGFDLKNDKLKYAETGDKNPFKDIRVRQAINMAVDRDAIVRTVMRGLASPTAQILAPGNVGYDPALDKAPKVDREGAKKLLAEAGYPEGFSFTLDCPNDRYVNDEQVCKTLVTMLAPIGLKANLNSMPRAKYFPKIWDRDTSMFMMGFNSPFFDGMYALETMLMTRDDAKGEGIYNYENYSNPALDKEIAAARDELDPAKRSAMMKAIYKKISDDTLYVSLYNQVLVYAMRKAVDAPVRPDNMFEIRWVTMK